MEHLVAKAKAHSTLSGIRPSGTVQTPAWASAKVNVGTSTSGFHQQPQNPNFSTGRFVKIDLDLAFPSSSGGKKPWVLKTVSEGLLLDFVSEPCQSHITDNVAMNATQWQLCDNEASSLIEKGTVIDSNGPCFISEIFSPRNRRFLFNH